MSSSNPSASEQSGRHGHPWSAAARARRAAQPKPPQLELGTASAQAAAHANPELHREAKDWIVRDPEHRMHRVRNLRRWLHNRLGPEQGQRIYNGLRQVRRSIRGKTKRAVGSAHGWTLFEDQQ